jgi:hypothetical protein
MKLCHGLVLRCSCVPEKVGVKEKDVNQKLFAHKKKKRQINVNKPAKRALNPK